MVPLIGAHHSEQSAESLGAAAVVLSAADLTAIEQAIPRGAAAGDRYSAPRMAALGSGRTRETPGAPLRTAGLASFRGRSDRIQPHSTDGRA
jgi:hypothetical protein